jgi:quercetin dioxygenase-like cupin family protein
VKPVIMLVMVAVVVVAFGAGFLAGRGGVPEGAPIAGHAGEPTATTFPTAGAPGAEDQAGAAQATGISRTLFMTVDSPGSVTHEVTMGVAELPAGVSSGLHVHPGIEVGYILEGTVELRHEGRATETLSAGGTFYNDAPHDAINVGTGPARILAVWVVEKGEPMTSSVP